MPSALPGPETPAVPAPVLAPRPSQHLDGVIRMVARCAPEDVIANRLDPWHGAHFHGHSFARLKVLEQAADSITVRVAFRVAGPVAVEVDARFHCPQRRSIACWRRPAPPPCPGRRARPACAA